MPTFVTAKLPNMFYQMLYKSETSMEENGE